MDETAILGRPSTSSNVDVDCVRALRLEGFSCTGVAAYFHISRQSLCRYLDQVDFQDPLVAINDAVLDEIVLQYLQGRPCGRGEVAVKAHVLSSGFKVSRGRIRSSIGRVDPIGRDERKRKPIKRRVYKVDGPHHLWHIDGHHKLIRQVNYILRSILQDI